MRAQMRGSPGCKAEVKPQLSRVVVRLWLSHNLVVWLDTLAMVQRGGCEAGAEPLFSTSATFGGSVSCFSAQQLHLVVQ